MQIERLKYITEEKENLKGLLSKTYELMDGLKKDYRFAVVMECLAVISLITAIIKWQNNEWLFKLVLLISVFCVVFGSMIFRGFKLLKRTLQYIKNFRNEENMDRKAHYINRVSVAVLLLLVNLTIYNNLDLSKLYISNYKISFTSGVVFLMLATFFRVTISRIGIVNSILNLMVNIIFYITVFRVAVYMNYILLADFMVSDPTEILSVICPMASITIVLAIYYLIDKTVNLIINRIFFGRIKTE